MHHLNKFISKDLMVGLPKLKFEKDHICETCQKGEANQTFFQNEKHCFNLQTP